MSTRFVLLSASKDAMTVMYSRLQYLFNVDEDGLLRGTVQLVEFRDEYSLIYGVYLNGSNHNLYKYCKDAGDDFTGKTRRVAMLERAQESRYIYAITHRESASTKGATAYDAIYDCDENKVNSVHYNIPNRLQRYVLDYLKNGKLPR